MLRQGANRHGKEAGPVDGAQAAPYPKRVRIGLTMLLTLGWLGMGPVSADPRPTKPVADEQQARDGSARAAAPQADRGRPGTDASRGMSVARAGGPTDKQAAKALRAGARGVSGRTAKHAAGTTDPTDGPERVEAGRSVRADSGGVWPQHLSEVPQVKDGQDGGGRGAREAGPEQPPAKDRQDRSRAPSREAPPPPPPVFDAKDR